MQPVLKLEGLTKKYGTRIAANNISFSIMPGEIYGFLGANGAGKSTTIKMLTGLITISGGDAFICGNSVKFNFEKAMQNYALPQGDIALFMNEYAECRSNTRGIIGYEDQEQIDLMVQKHDGRVENTYNRLESIKTTIVTKEGKEAYAKIEAALEAYFLKVHD